MAIQRVPRLMRARQKAKISTTLYCSCCGKERPTKKCRVTNVSYRRKIVIHYGVPWSEDEVIFCDDCYINVYHLLDAKTHVVYEYENKDWILNGITW